VHVAPAAEAQRRHGGHRRSADRDLLGAPITTLAEQMILMLGEPGTDLKDSQLRALVDRLAVFDVTYLTGGSADADEVSPYHAPKDVNIDALVLDLTRASSPRLRDALIALLLRHPEVAPAVRRVHAAMASDDSARRMLLSRLLAAAALQYKAGAALPAQPRIAVGDLVRRLHLPSLEERGGQALLEAAARLLAGPYPIDWVNAWEDVLAHILWEVHGAAQPGVPVVRG